MMEKLTMLNAIIHGKAGRVERSGESTSIGWKQVFQQREDLLTAAFFSRFTYLSGLLQHRLLKGWMGSVGDFSTFEAIDYWPKYEFKARDDRNFVEPDLLIRFSDCDVLIEVKPPQGGDQSLDQWQLEIEGYFSQEEQIKPLYFLAVGRTGDTLSLLNSEAIREKYPLFQTANAIEWKPIAGQLHNLMLSGELDAQDQRIVGDMLEALKLYNIRANDLLWSDLYKVVDSKRLSMNTLSAWR